MSKLISCKSMKRDSGKMNGKVTLDDFCRELCLEKIYYNSSELDLTDSGINRPGIQLHGYYKHFDANRIQVIGKVEIAYLMDLDVEVREQKIDDFFACEFPCFIVCWNLDEVSLFLDAAKKYKRTLLKSNEHTTSLFYHLVDYIDRISAPMINLHGVLVEVFGVGVLITGPSGIGKSETALEIVKRGHCLIADDVVEVTRIRDSHLMGTAPVLLQHFMEIRGIGIIDIKTLYGARGVKQVVEIDMVIRLENWDERSPYDRLGLDEKKLDILGIEIPEVMIPVSGGRNLASIIETAAINNRTKQYGYHSAQVFCDRVAHQNELEADKRKNK